MIIMIIIMIKIMIIMIKNNNKIMIIMIKNNDNNDKNNFVGFTQL